jgi:hypothetical protein
MLCGAESITKLYEAEKKCDHVNKLTATQKKWRGENLEVVGDAVR